MAWRLPSPVLHCIIRKFRYLQKLRYFPLALFPRLRIFCYGTSIALSTKLVLSSSTIELVDNTYMTVDESWLFTTSQSTVILLTSLWICCTTVELLSTVVKILAYSVSHCLSTVAELFVITSSLLICSSLYVFGWLSS